jgi:hypothetical protein
MTQCCDDAGKCTQGINCAIRSASEQPIRPHIKRRYRAGEPAKVELPPLPIDVAKADNDGLMWHDWLWVGVVVAMIVYLLAEIVFGLGLL